MHEATTGDGHPAPTAYAALLLVTARIGAFLIVNDRG